MTSLPFRQYGSVAGQGDGKEAHEDGTGDRRYPEAPGGSAGRDVITSYSIHYTKLYEKALSTE